MVCVSEGATTLYTVHGIHARKPAVQWGHRVPGVVFFFWVDPTDRWAPGPGRLIKLALPTGLDLRGGGARRNMLMYLRDVLCTRVLFISIFRGSLSWPSQIEGLI